MSFVSDTLDGFDDAPYVSSSGHMVGNGDHHHRQDEQNLTDQVRIFLFTHSCMYIVRIMMWNTEGHFCYMHGHKRKKGK